MFLDYCLHPTLLTQYFFPKRQADLTVANTRKNVLFTVPGGGGPINPRGAAPFDREPNQITYSFQINPIGDGKNVDTMRDAFLRAVDHGLPQTLAFRTDSGAVWFQQCILAASPHHQTAGSDASHIIEATWFALTDYATSPATPGTAVFGTYFKFGNNVRFGAQAQKFTLSAPSQIVTIDNTLSAATVATTDPIIILKGPFGQTPPTSYPIVIYCEESRIGMYLTIALGANDTLSLDFASKRILLNGQPAFGIIKKTAVSNPSYISFLPNTINHLEVYIANATGAATYGGQLSIQWKPKRSI